MAWAEAYPSTKWHLDPCSRLATTRGPKLGAAMPPFRGEQGSHLTQCRLGRGLPRTKWHLNPSSRLATTDMGQKLGVVSLFGEREIGPHLKQCGPEAYLHTKFILESSNRLATIHQRYRQTDRTDRQTTV